MVMKLGMSWVPFLADTFFGSLFFHVQADALSLLLSFVCTFSTTYTGFWELVTFSFSVIYIPECERRIRSTYT